FASSGWPSPKSSPPKVGASIAAPDWVVVQDENGCADGAVVEAQFGQHFAGVEAEVGCDPTSFLGGGKLREASDRGEEQNEQHAAELHRALAQVFSPSVYPA